jgi:hypothetical protein
MNADEKNRVMKHCKEHSNDMIAHAYPYPYAIFFT